MQLQQHKHLENIDPGPLSDNKTAEAIEPAQNIKKKTLKKRVKLDFTREGLTELIKRVHADNPDNFTTSSFQRQNVKPQNKQPWEKNANTFYSTIKCNLSKLRPIFQAIQTEWDEVDIDYEPDLFTIKENISTKDLFSKTLAILCPEEAKDFHKPVITYNLNYSRESLTELIKQVHADNPDSFTTSSFKRRNIKPADKQPWEKNACTFYREIKNNFSKLKPIFKEIQTEWDKNDIKYEPSLFDIKENISKKDLFAKTLTILCPQEAEDFYYIRRPLDCTRDGLTKLIKQVHSDDPANFNASAFSRHNINPQDKQPWEKNALTFYCSIKRKLPKLRPIFEEIQAEWDEVGNDYEPDLFTIKENISTKDLFAKTLQILCPVEVIDFQHNVAKRFNFTHSGLAKVIKQVYIDNPANFNTESFRRRKVADKQSWEKNAKTFYNNILEKPPKLRLIFEEIQAEWDKAGIDYEPDLFTIKENISTKDLFAKTIRILAPETYPSFKYNALIAPLRGYMLQYAFESALKILGHNLGDQLKIEHNVGSKKPDLVYYNPDKQIEIMFDVKLQTHNASSSGDTISYPKLLAKHGHPDIKKHLVFLCLNGERGKTEYDKKKNVKISYINVLKLLKDTLGTEVSQPKQYPYKFLNTSPDLTTDQKLTLSRIYKFLNHLKTMVSENKHHIDLSDGDFKKLQTAHNKMRNRLRKLARKGTRQDIMNSDIWEKFDDLN